MRNSIKRLSRKAGICLMLVILLLSGCSPKQVESAKYRTDKAELNYYYSDLSEIKSVEYEQVYKSYVILGMEMGLSPSDPEYRGIIHLTEEAGEKMFSDHQWKENSATLPVFTTIDTAPLNSDTWYEYDDYNFDIFNTSMCFVEYFRFNGKDMIVFDIQTH